MIETSLLLILWQSTLLELSDNTARRGLKLKWLRHLPVHSRRLQNRLLRNLRGRIDNLRVGRLQLHRRHRCHDLHRYLWQLENGRAHIKRSADLGWMALLHAAAREFLKCLRRHVNHGNQRLRQWLRLQGVLGLVDAEKPHPSEEVSQEQQEIFGEEEYSLTDHGQWSYSASRWSLTSRKARICPLLGGVFAGVATRRQTRSLPLGVRVRASSV